MARLVTGGNGSRSEVKQHMTLWSEVSCVVGPAEFQG